MERNKFVEYLLMETTSNLINRSQNTFQGGLFSSCNNRQQEIERMLLLALEHKLHIVFNKFIEEGNKIDSEKLIMKYNGICQLRKAHFKELQRIAKVFNQHEIRYVIVKGVPLSLFLYHQPYIRGIGDIDIIVGEKELGKAFEILSGMGYMQTNNVESKNPIFFYGVHHHEIVMHKNSFEGRICVELKKRSSCLADDFDGWWKYVVKRQIGEVEVSVLTLDAEILHMILNAFSNNESRGMYLNCKLRDYFDVAYALRNIQINWDEMFCVAESMRLTNQIVTVFQSVRQIYPCVNEYVTPLLEILQESYCKYERLPFYFGAEKYGFTNFGLPLDVPKADLTYSIFEHDFSVYQFLKTYKAAIYSKYNKDYKYRKILKYNEEMRRVKYDNSQGIIAEYSFLRSDEMFDIVVRIDKKCKMILEKMIVF